MPAVTQPQTERLPPPPPPPLEVLVTGFGPFTNIPSNPSFTIVSSLPPTVNLPSGRLLRIHVHPVPVRVAYTEVATLVPQLYARFPAVDLFVHVGVGTSLDGYKVEVRARREPYDRADVDGRTWSNGVAGADPHALPAECWADLNVSQVLDRAFKSDAKPKPSISDDAGLYLCEFIYFNSLVMAQRLREAGGKKVSGVFLHVPKGTTLPDIERGREVLLRLLVGLAGEEP
ncbi:MAG: TRAPP subunit [Chaenotheca gracillima]|nr:MAG: TRAPP subunit [Chaenotheca gracillima]